MLLYGWVLLYSHFVINDEMPRWPKYITKLARTLLSHRKWFLNVGHLCLFVCLIKNSNLTFFAYIIPPIYRTIHVKKIPKHTHTYWSIHTHILSNYTHVTPQLVFCIGFQKPELLWAITRTQLFFFSIYLISLTMIINKDVN